MDLSSTKSNEQTWKTCRPCNGTGRIVTEFLKQGTRPCQLCQGRGEIPA